MNRCNVVPFSHGLEMIFSVVMKSTSPWDIGISKVAIGFQKWQEPRDVEKKKYEGFFFMSDMEKYKEKK